MTEQNAEYVPLDQTDEMSLGELIELAGRTISGYHPWSEWLESYYDPAKSALVDLLREFGVVTQNAEYGRTCEDRGYICCEGMPPPENPTSEEYQVWYDAHVANYLDVEDISWKFDDIQIDSSGADQ